MNRLMHHKKWILLFTFAAVFIFGLVLTHSLVKIHYSTTVQASYPDLTNPELAQKSDVVAVCKVLEKKPAHTTRSIEQDAEVIVTDFVVEIQGDTVNPEDKVFILRTKGGQIDNEYAHVADSAFDKLVVGQKYVMFLTEKLPDDTEGDYFRLSYLASHSIYSLPDSAASISMFSQDTADDTAELESLGRRENMPLSELQGYLKLDS